MSKRILLLRIELSLSPSHFHTACRVSFAGLQQRRLPESSETQGNNADLEGIPRCSRLVILEPSYTVIEEGHWKSLYSTQIHGSSGPVLTHAFPQILPAPNIRMLAATPTVRQDAGGFCPVLSSHREACLEASCQLAAFLWQ